MSEQSKLKIGHTVWPNGHMCIWSKVNVDEMFGYDKYGRYWFVWAGLHKEKKEIKKDEEGLQG